jgi:uncharacterized protein (TIGR03089 family)
LTGSPIAHPARDSSRADPRQSSQSGRAERGPGAHAGPAAPGSPEAAFAAALAADPGRPLITYYDAATGERVELSARSLGNWIAKTHHLLSAELGLGPGDLAYQALPAHWMSAVALLGAFSAGLSITEEAGGAGAAGVAFVTAATAAATLAGGAEEIYGLSLAPLGRPFDPSPPSGCEDFVLAVRPMPDAWSSVRPPAGGDDPAITAGGQAQSRTQTMADAVRRAARIGLAPGARLIVIGEQDWRDWLLAPLAAGASVVLVAGLDPDAAESAAAIERIAAAERVTATLR